MKIGLIGTGRMAVRRAANVLAYPGAELAWVASRSADSARELIDQLELGDAPRPEAIEGWRAALDRGDVDAVIVTSPNAVHADQMSAALEARLHVLCEYPLTANLEHYDALTAQSGSVERILHIGATNRHDTLHLELKTLLRPDNPDRAALGRPRAYLVTACSGNPISRWYDRDELSGGMFVASFYHFVDDALDLLGPTAGEPVARYTSRRQDDGRILQDCGHLLQSFESGCTAQMTYARGYPKPGLGFRRTVVCQSGFLHVEGGAIVQRSPEGEARIEPDKADSVELDTHDFLKRVEEGYAPSPTLAACRASHELVFRAQSQVSAPRG